MFARPGVFFSTVFLLTFLQIQLFLKTLCFEPGHVFLYLWILAFSFLALNISILAAQAIFRLFVKAPDFPKVEASQIVSLPVALLYCVRNEGFGLKERIRFTLQGNLLQNLSFWVLSDSDVRYGEAEEKIVRELREEFGEEKIFYRRRPIPEERKQGNIKEWLVEYGPRYKYFVVCDADSLLPEGWVEEALRIAEHPHHTRIGIFQSAIYVAHDASLYSRMLALGQFYAQRLYFHVNQAVLGRSISFGHNCLIRREAYEKITLPRGILSHDNWETALLEKEGYQTVFLSELVSFEEAPPHDLEEKRRSKRWLRGTLQGWPLLFLPRISFSTRFHIFYQIYLYGVQPVLFFWCLSGLIASPAFRNGMFASERNALFLSTLTLLVLFGHKFTAAGNLADAKRILRETLFSTLLGLQNVFYGTLNFLLLSFEEFGWIPMVKNPIDRPTLLECFRGLLLGTLVGVLGLWVGFHRSSAWTFFALPVLASLIFSIPAVYRTSKAEG